MQRTAAPLGSWTVQVNFNAPIAAGARPSTHRSTATEDGRRRSLSWSFGGICALGLTGRGFAIVLSLRSLRSLRFDLFLFCFYRRERREHRELVVEAQWHDRPPRRVWR